MGVTLPSVLEQFVGDIAFAAEAQPAKKLEEFIDQLGTAAHNLGFFAGLNGAEDLEIAAVYLRDAMEAEDSDRDTALSKALKYLEGTDDMVDDYRMMV